MSDGGEFKSGLAASAVRIICLRLASTSQSVCVLTSE